MSVPEGDRNARFAQAPQVAVERRKVAPDVVEVRKALAVGFRIGLRAVAAHLLAADREGGGIREHLVHEGARVRQELEDVHRRNVEDGPFLHLGHRLRIQRIENAVRQGGRPEGDGLLRVREIRCVHRRAQALPARLGKQRARDVRLHAWKRGLRGATPGHVVEHQLDLEGAERPGRAHGLPSLFGRTRNAVDARAGRLALVPPAPLRREDRRRRKDVGKAGPGIPGPFGELPAAPTSSAMSRTEVTPQRSISSRSWSVSA